MSIRHIYFLLFVVFPWLVEGAKLPELTPHIVKTKMDEIMKEHPTYKRMTPTLVKRALVNFLEELDPTKTYFIQTDIEKWTNPSDQLIEQILNDYNHEKFTEFDAMYKKMLSVIPRRHELDQIVDRETLPSHVNPDEFKDLKWAKDEQDLLTRLIKIKALQMEAVAKLPLEMKERTLQRIVKRQAKLEEEILTQDPAKQQALILTDTLKALASSLDTHTAYFTPEEASQFMINVQQRLFGIGAQLRDDLNGFTIVKIVDGGPAALSKQLKLKDRIIAINSEPVVGMDIVDAVELIRGPENTPVTLTVVREVQEGETKKEVTMDITLIRGEVVLKETRYESSYEPFGDGVIAYLRLYSFYQDAESSSATDLEKELKKMEEKHKVLGVILDLRSNAGGMLTQAVAVSGLFVSKGVIVSIKDEDGSVQHLRHLESKVAWKGPLIVLINRASASASEIVAQTLQDYGRALILGDDHSYGKGSFQTFTLNIGRKTAVNPQGEYKVTRGRYYTVSGKSPQLIGVKSDIVIPGPLSESEIGESYAKYPLETDSIKEEFDDDLSDVPYEQRERIASLYKFNMQSKLKTYNPYIVLLKTNSQARVQYNKNYQAFLKELKKKDKTIEDEENEQFGQNDLQLIEAYNIMKDLIILMSLHQSFAA